MSANADLTLRCGPQGRVSKGRQQMVLRSTLRDATLRVAPPGEGFIPSMRELLEIPR
jgi:hypothetical protein